MLPLRAPGTSMSVPSPVAPSRRFQAWSPTVKFFSFNLPEIIQSSVSSEYAIGLPFLSAFNAD